MAATSAVFWGLALATLATVTVVPGAAQTPAAIAAAAAVAPPLPPATKLEAFKPAVGSVVTFGYNELGKVAGVSVDVRELRDTKGAVVRGLSVEVVENEYRDESSFVDADEIDELLNGIDALLATKSNPTKFNNFEVRYTTRGDLRIVAFNTGRNIEYGVRAGRTLKAERVGLDEGDLRKIRGFIQTAQQQLAAERQ